MLENKKNISGAYIQVRRKAMKLAQVDLSEALKSDFNLIVEQSDISEIERGIRGVKDFELDAIAQILEIDPTQLLRGE